MPVRPMPLTYKCPKCHWQATTSPKSDVIGPGDRYTECPRCHYATLEVAPASWLEVLVGQLKKPFG